MSLIGVQSIPGAVTGFLVQSTTSSPWVAVIVILGFYLASLCIYRVYLHPLAAVPGPFLAKCSSLWLYYHVYIGNECSTIRQLHKSYGPVLRVGPNDVDIADGDAIATIYSNKADFPKSEYYTKFDVDGHASIFSTVVPSYRASRVKAVMPMFSAASIRESKHVIDRCVVKFIARLKREADSGEPVDMMNLARSLACDVTATYLFHEEYGALDETTTRLSASHFVDSFVSVGRFFYLPTSLFIMCEWLSERFYPDEKVSKSISTVDAYISRFVKGRQRKAGNYSDRLLSHGISVAETMAQCKDLVFAGTYSTGMTIATLCWLIAQHPDK
jgi:cytochrome P450